MKNIYPILAKQKIKAMRRHMLSIKNDQETGILSFDYINMGWPGID